MKIETAVVKQYRLEQLRRLLQQQEANLRHFENKVVEALEEKLHTQDKIEELEAELEAHELTNL